MIVLASVLEFLWGFCNLSAALSLCLCQEAKVFHNQFLNITPFHTPPDYLLQSLFALSKWITSCCLILLDKLNKFNIWGEENNQFLRSLLKNLVPKTRMYWWWDGGEWFDMYFRFCSIKKKKKVKMRNFALLPFPYVLLILMSTLFGIHIEESPSYEEMVKKKKGIKNSSVIFWLILFITRFIRLLWYSKYFYNACWACLLFSFSWHIKKM